MTDDLPARLLAKIADVEHAALGDEPAPWASDVLALCRAHREIVELHLVCRADAALALKMLEDASATTRREYFKAERDADAAEARLMLSSHILDVISRGYGMEEES